MLENILEYEHDLFLQLNSFQSPFGNQFIWLFSGKAAWIPVAVFFIAVLFYKNKHRWKEVLLLLTAIVLVITLCDQFSSGFCKPFFMRFRPTHHPDFMNKVNVVFDYRGGDYGFISSHAANAFGFAMLTSLIFRHLLYSATLFAWATVNSYSRIYLGVHFISDIIPGIIVGLIFGWLVYKIYISLNKKLIAGSVYVNVDNKKANQYTYDGLNIIVYLLLLTVIIIAVISLLYVYNFIPPLLIK